VSQLLRQLRSSGAVDTGALETAMRRQQIYGGSLDTVLLELDLLDPATLAREIAAANECENVSVALIDPGPERPWDALPPALLDLGWAMPVRRYLGHVQVVVHPEIPPEQRRQLEQAIEHLQVFTSCEACLAKLAAERRGSVMPQRYAVLALKWKQALMRELPEPTREPSAPAAPWMSAAPDTAPYAVPSPDVLNELPASSPRPKPRAESEPATRSPTFLYGLPVDDDDDEPLPADDTPADDDTPASSADELAPAGSDAVPDAREAADTSDGSREDIPLPRTVERGAEARPSATPEAPSTAGLAERLADPRSALERATSRDQTTDALIRAAMVLSPRAALFGLKREGLRGIVSSDEIADVTTQLVELSPKINAAVEGEARLDRVTDLDLRIAVGQEMAVPCLFLPINVHSRPVLMFYVDRNGEPFTDEEVRAAEELCEIAGRTLEEVLRRMRASGPVPASTNVAPQADAGEPVAAATTEPTEPAEPAASAAPPKPSVFAPPNSILPPGAFSPPGSFSPPSGFSPPKPTAPPVAPSPAAPPVPVAVPVPPVAPASSVAPIPQGSPIAPPANPIAPPAKPFAPPKPIAPANPITPPAKPVASTPVASTPVAKPPVRLEPVDAPAPKPPSSAPRSAPGVTALSPPLGDAGSIRGRITIDQEDDERPVAQQPEKSEDNPIDSAILAAMRGGSAAIEHLRELGEPALVRIAKLFPGELDVQRRDLDTLPPLPAHGPLIRVALELPELGPYLVDIIDHANPTVRFYVAFVFMELRHPRAIAALGELAFDPDADVRAIAMRVLETYSDDPGFGDTVAVIRRELDSPNRTRQLHSTRAVGTVRDIAAVPKLIDLLTSKERYIQEAALESLCSITGQQLGLKPHRWRSWYADNAHHHRVEWIISSLAHKDLSVRRWAADELRRITGQRINFLAAGNKQEREIGIRKWAEWWSERGRIEFGA
jgi:HEAT repeat protein